MKVCITIMIKKNNNKNKNNIGKNNIIQKKRANNSSEWVRCSHTIAVTHVSTFYSMTYCNRLDKWDRWALRRRVCDDRSAWLVLFEVSWGVAFWISHSTPRRIEHRNKVRQSANRTNGHWREPQRKSKAMHASEETWCWPPHQGSPW